MKDTLRQITNLITVIIALTVNILASTLPINGQNTGEISDRSKSTSSLRDMSSPSGESSTLA